jgi:hypothetical protein
MPDTFCDCWIVLGFTPIDRFSPIRAIRMQSSRSFGQLLTHTSMISLPFAGQKDPLDLRLARYV